MKNKNIKICNIVRIVFFILLLARLYLVDRFTEINGIFEHDFINNYNFYNSKITYFIIFIIRFLIGGSAIAILIEPFNKFDFVKQINAYFAPIVYLFALIFTKQLTLSYINPENSTYVFRLIITTLESLSAIMIGILELVSLKQESNLKIENLVKTTLFFLFLCLFADNNSTPQLLFGKKNIIIVQFLNLGHLITLAIAFAIVLSIMLFLRNKEKDFITLILLCLSIGVFMRHNYYYEIQFDPFSFNSEIIPLNLCHIGIYLMPIVLVTKNKNLAIFTVVNSVIGGLYAFCYPAACFGLAITDELTLHFILNHAMLIVIPNLMYKYKLFEPISFNKIPNLLVVTAIYYVIVCLANTILPNFLSGVSYFGGNKETAYTVASIIPIFERTLDYDFTFHIGKLTFIIYYQWWFVLFIGILIGCTMVGYGLYRFIRLIEGLLDKRNVNTNSNSI